LLRNHDELTLEMGTVRERDYLWETYASERRARLNLGIRRRLAPLLEQDRRRIELLNSLLLSMPGTPVIYYGDEIGMGDNIHLGDRDGVRTPMQWSPDRNGGFSRIDPAKLVLPVIMDANYGYQAINVEAESLNPHSLLNWMRRMLAIRKRHCAFGRGSMTMLNPTNRRVLAYLREHGGRDGQGETILCVANLSRAAQAVELDLSSYGSMVPVEMIGNSAFPPIGQLPYLLTLPPYGFFWFMLSAPARMPDWHQPPPEPMPDYMTLVIRKDVTEIFSGAALEALEHKILPAYLPRRRWFASKDQKLDSVKIVEATIMQTPTRPIALMEIETRSGGAVDRYLLPLGRINENEVISALPGQIALARIRRGREIGFLTDAFTLDRLAYGILDGLRKQQVLPARDGAVHFIPTERMAELDIPPDAAIRRLAVEQSNSSLIVGEQAMIKILRRIHPGEHPEAEMGRLLTARGYANIAPLLGEVVRIAADGTPHLLAVVQGYIHSQGDAWAWTLQQLERALHPGVDTPGGEPEEVQSLVTQWFGRLGTRVGELHAVLAQDSSDPAFAPERVTEQQCAAWASAVQSQIDDALSRIKQHRESLDPADAALGDALAASSAPLHAAAATLARAGLGSLMTRTHGDLHLGQVLVAQGDAYIIDFEGEPARPLAERRGKSSPLRDVAGMLRSIDYVRAKAAEQALGVEGARDAQEIEAQLDRFRAAAQHAFLEAYFAASATIAHGWAGDSAPQALIDLFTLEKAAYEIAYEAANRPPWLRVPLRGLAETAQRLGALESANG
jgi:maltose alpha-D-glucosyltransferase/alpha-amylase